MVLARLWLKRFIIPVTLTPILSSDWEREKRKILKIPMTCMNRPEIK